MYCFAVTVHAKAYEGEMVTLSSSQNLSQYCSVDPTYFVVYYNKSV
jgi:hypothetical protein